MRYNVIAKWLEIIGTQERAQRLLQPWSGDPAEVLLGERQAQLAYAYAPYRAALDSWDTGHTTRKDLVLWAKHVVSGQYKGSYFAAFVTTDCGDRVQVDAIVANGSEARQAQMPPLPGHTDYATVAPPLRVVGPA